LTPTLNYREHWISASTLPTMIVCKQKKAFYTTTKYVVMAHPSEVWELSSIHYCT